MNDKKKFDQVEYAKSYNKSHYKEFKTRVKEEEAEKITEYCDKIGVSKNQLLIKSALYIINHNIDISE